MSKTIVKKGRKTIVIYGSGTYIVELTGEDVSAQIVGVFVLCGDERVKIHTVQHHKAPNTTSDLLIKAVLFDKSRLEYDGLIKIDKKAQHSNAYQRNENLLMGNGVNVSSKPELEIEANEVRCTHGATMGMIDENQIFYLMSRGIARSSAEQMIVEGFLKPVFGRLSKNEVKKLKTHINKKIHQSRKQSGILHI